MEITIKNMEYNSGDVYISLIDKDKLIKIRKSSGISLRELSKNTGIHFCTIHAYEVGRIAPSKDKIKTLADYFGVPVEEFFFDSIQIKKDVYYITNQDLENWKAETCLEFNVKKMLLNAVEKYDRPIQLFRVLLCGCGCGGGIISELISNDDTTKFYEKHKKEIQDMVNNYMKEIGWSSIVDMFGDKWDEEDYFCNNDYNKNILAWFAFEETARKISDDLGINL